MTVQDIGVTLVIVGFIAWTIAWVGLLSYGLAWVRRDRTGAVVSIAAAAIVLLSGMLVLVQTPGGLK